MRLSIDNCRFLCYTGRMMIKEQLFEVKQGDKTHVIKAFDIAHAKRIAARLFGGEVIECEALKQFPRFDRKKVGEFNR